MHMRELKFPGRTTHALLNESEKLELREKRREEKRSEKQYMIKEYYTRGKFNEFILSAAIYCSDLCFVMKINLDSKSFLDAC